jgi:polyhydroxyalkanoate synthesis regulator phasin
MAVKATERVYTTGELAEHLGVSANMARRYGLAWERITSEEIPQQPGRGRMYPRATLEALEGARAWLIKHPSGSVETALRITLGLEQDPLEEPKHIPGQLSRDEIREAVREAIAEGLAAIMTQLEAVRAENEGLKRQLEALPSPSEGSEVNELAKRIEELERRNQALRNELERRDREAEEKGRPWWRLWQRKSA